MKRGNPKPLPPKLRAELRALAAMPDNEIDTAEMPPITDYRVALRGPKPVRASRPPHPRSA